MQGRLAEMIARHAGPGRVRWIGLRPARRGPVIEVEAAEIGASGLVGDHARPGARAVTLIQAEHLDPVRALARAPEAGFADLRRNLAVAGINLAALRGRRVQLGGAVLRIAGPCAPCSRMEAALGPGGHSAMRGHGGMTAEVLVPGALRLGDAVIPLDDSAAP
ncbi:MOSC domain-containing protein [Albimonas pacifica]|uniref:MOSC domain-containing protein n=1 Tax=Albimonas pacifica TaxID=1114924 RepID=A0A1I3MJC1_9RHOB|nr:MOSC domain-containing protein [Albimonas pacifica]SFI97089.1 MOSC domain-containing protein [Albimonas pacifica]